MKRLVETTFAGGGVMLVEVEDVDAAPVDSPRRVTRGMLSPKPDGVGRKVIESFEDAVRILSPTAAAIVDSMAERERGPDMIAVNFGLSMTAQAGVVVAQGSVGATMSVTMTWLRQPPPAT